LEAADGREEPDAGGVKPRLDGTDQLLHAAAQGGEDGAGRGAGLDGARPLRWAAALAIARILRWAANMPRVREPYSLSISTRRGSTVRALSCVASPP